MKNLTRSKLLSLFLGVALLTFILPQGRIVNAQTTDDSTSEPVVVVTVGSINKLMQDVNYVSGLVGQPQAGGIFALMAGTFTQGVDTTQPIAITVPLVNGMPQPLALIPTADVKTVLTRLEAQTGPVDELKDGTLVIAVGVNTVYIRQQGDWAIIAPDRDVLSLAPTDPASLFGEDADQYDLSLKLKMQQVPAPMRTMITSQMRLGFEQAMAQQGGADAEATQELAETSLAQIEQLITDTDELEFSFNVDQTGKAISIKTRFTAVEGSPLASTLSSQKPIPSQFASVIRPDAAAFFHSAAAIGPESIDQAVSSLKTVETSLLEVMKAQGELPPEVQDQLFAWVSRILDLATDSINEGKSDIGAVLLAGENNLRLALGTFISDGNEVAKLAKDFAAKVKDYPDAPTFEFDREVYKGVTMHLAKIDIPAYEEEARSIFGESFDIHIGTADKAIYLALGKDSKSLLTEIIDAQGSDSSTDRPVGQVQIKLLPMFEFAQSAAANDFVMAMIDSLSRSADAGKIMYVQESIPNGQEVEISIGEGLLQAVGAAVRQVELEAQQNAIQNGQF